jgi:hypothetical protein
MQRYLHEHTAVFEPDAILILTSALDDAWQSLQTAGASFASRGQVDATRELLALRIIEMAKLGQRDRRHLSEDALLYLARSNLRASGL